FRSLLPSPFEEPSSARDCECTESSSALNRVSGEALARSSFLVPHRAQIDSQEKRTLPQLAQRVSIGSESVSESVSRSAAASVAACSAIVSAGGTSGSGWTGVLSDTSG